MTDRSALSTDFLRHAGWAGAQRTDLAGDASNRRYERLVADDGACAVLMDAPPERGEDVRPFVHIARHLRTVGLSPPEILSEDPDNGFLLLEDLGDALFARVLQQDPTAETTLYAAATDVLVTLHRATPPQGLHAFDPQAMSEMATQAFRWYLQGTGAPSEAAAARFQHLLRDLLERHARETTVLILRDYHAENLLWLPHRTGPARVGLLDFQDGMLSHPAYDLVSLLQDARRDVDRLTESAMIDRYIAATEVERGAFEAAYHVLGVQRNLRILGVFARLSLRFGKPHYVDFIPRVWGYLRRDLAHPALAPIAETLLSDLPEPGQPILNALKEQCAKYPTL